MSAPAHFTRRQPRRPGRRAFSRGSTSPPSTHEFSIGVWKPEGLSRQRRFDISLLGGQPGHCPRSFRKVSTCGCRQLRTCKTLTVLRPLWPRGTQSSFRYVAVIESNSPACGALDSNVIASRTFSVSTIFWHGLLRKQVVCITHRCVRLLFVIPTCGA